MSYHGEGAHGSCRDDQVERTEYLLHLYLYTPSTIICILYVRRKGPRNTGRTGLFGLENEKNEG